MSFYPIPDPRFYESTIRRPGPTVVYFFDGSAGPSDEFEILDREIHPASHLETFFVDVAQFAVPNAPSDVPVTILFDQGEQVDTAKGGDIAKFFELLERAGRES